MDQMTRLRQRVHTLHMLSDVLMTCDLTPSQRRDVEIRRAEEFAEIQKLMHPAQDEAAQAVPAS